MENEDPIKSPFEAPEGYFDRFESRLSEKIAEKQKTGMKVTHSGRRMVWAAAAAVLLLLSGLWYFTQQGKSDLVNGKVVGTNQFDSLLPGALAIEKEEGKKAELIENAVLAEILDNNWQPVSAAYVVIHSEEDRKIAEVLEEEGLIDLGIEDGLFEEIEL